ncbi:MAG TPA: arylsulfatase [Caldilineae bacterium]|nr:arylsulfatase [Caldilineae bacterium]
MRRPNILLILVDDMGYGDFGVFNDGSLKTPTLDRLVEEGVCLTQHYSASPVCAPARAALLTGRYPHRTGAIDTLEGRGLDRLALREVTIADLLKQAGYVTGLIGKWHLGALDPRYHPNNRGFDEFVGFRGGWQDYYEWRLDYNDTYRKSDGRYLTDVFTEEAVQFIRRHSKEPFFLHLAYNAPHFPFQAPEEEVAPFRETGKFTKAVSTIYGMIQRMDKGLERVLEELKRQGIEDNTLVLFTSDNGPQFGGEGEMCTTRFNCGFNGAKGLVYEGGIRVPMVLRWPDGLDGGHHFHEMVHFVDWLPTLLAAAGLEPPRDLALDGQNVLPVLRGEGGKVETRRFWQWNRYTPLVTCNAAMRDGPWKLVRPAIREAMVVSPEDLAMDRALKYEPDRFTDICRDPEPPREVPPPPPPQLFNIEQDPLEQHDLAASEPERVAWMLRELETWFESVEAERRNIRDAVSSLYR